MMGLNEIVKLRDDALRSLDESHDYYAHTEAAWRLVQGMVRQGRTFTIRNHVTGKSVGEKEFSGLAQGYVTGYLASATFQHFVSLFELFIFNFLRAWLSEYPRQLAGKKLQFQVVLDATDRNEIISSVVEKELFEVAHGRVADWFEYLDKLVHLGCPTKDQVQRLAEIKASRDVLVHNNGIVNSIYIAKSMGLARFDDGAVLELPERYHRESWQLIKDVVRDIANAAVKKK
jgi:hypothetical protein